MNKALRIRTGEDKKLTFCAHVTRGTKSVIELGSGMKNLSTDVRLIVRKSRELFVAVEGEYWKTAWGTSVDTLVLYRQPMRFIEPREKMDVRYDESVLCVAKEIWHLVDALMSSRAHENEKLFLQEADRKEVEEIKQCVDTGSEIDDSVSDIAVGTCVSAEPIRIFPHPACSV